MTGENRYNDPLQSGDAGLGTRTTRQYSPAQQLLRELLDVSLVLSEDWHKVPEKVREQLGQSKEVKHLLEQLVEQQLLTPYQAERLATGRREGLILGNYRVLERLGAGGMGVVFKAEHRLMRRLVAIKVLPLQFEDNQLPLARFLAEIRTLAKLQHPNIVAALDAGQFYSSDPRTPNLYYFVMELVTGQDLEELVKKNGPMPVAQVCDLACQVASALAETHKHGLVHRDIKPSNILVTPEGQAKLLDFGLARHYHDRHLTQPGVVLGTVDYMAPEQARDTTALDIRADLYSLGATLFWCLAGQPPYPTKGDLIKDLMVRQTQPPPSLRTLRQEVPAELDNVLQRLMALNADDRFPNPQTVMRAFLPFLRTDSQERLVPVTMESGRDQQTEAILFPPSAGYWALVVDDDDSIRFLLRNLLQAEGIACDEANDGLKGWEAAQTKPYDLFLLDIDMPGLTGPELLRRLREKPTSPHAKVIMLSGGVTPDEMSQLLMDGADDFLPKPLSLVQLKARLQSALGRKTAEDRTDLLNRQLLAINGQLERNLQANASDLTEARNALVLALAELVEWRTGQKSGHLPRMQRYVRFLAEQAALTPSFRGQIDPLFLDMLECVAPLHDIGLVALPDHILQNPGKLTPDERLIMQTHTTLGADILQRIAHGHGSALAFLQMAIDVTRHHHERYDGSGYPDRLSGANIPLPARLVALCDVYDALRSRRNHRPALSHPLAVQIMTVASPGHFDSLLLKLFSANASEFERLFQTMSGGSAY